MNVFRFVIFIVLSLFIKLVSAQSPAPVEPYQTQTVRIVSVFAGEVVFTSTVYGTVTVGKSQASVVPVECVLNGRIKLVDTAYKLTATARCSKWGLDILPGVVPQVVMFDGVNRSDAAYSDGAMKASLLAGTAGGEWISVMMIPLSYPEYRFVSAPIQVGEFSKSMLASPVATQDRFRR